VAGGGISYLVGLDGNRINDGTGVRCGAARPDPATTVFLDNGPGLENGSATYDPDTRTSGKGKYKVFGELAKAVAALKQADVLFVRAGTYSRVVRPNVKVHGNHVNYWEGALAINVTGTPERHKVVSAYRNEEVIIQATAAGQAP
jgi:hypothetical protein